MNEKQSIYVPHNAARHRTALIVLALMCFFWGTTFPLMKSGIPATSSHLPHDAQDAAPVIFLMLRYFVAVLCVLPLLALEKNLKPHFTKRAFGFSSVLALLFLASMYFQVYGLHYISPAVSAFLTSMSVVFVPLAMWLVLRKPPARHVFMAALLALAGVAAISYKDGMFDPQQFDNTLEALLGIGLTLGCAFCFAIFIIYTDYTTVREHPTVLTLLLVPLTFAGSLITVASMVDLSLVIDSLPALISDSEVMIPVVVTAAFATALATYAWNRWQRELSPSRAAVLYSTEPVFASIVSISLSFDSFSVLLLVGASCIIVANLWCELGGKKAKAPATEVPDLQNSSAASD